MTGDCIQYFGLSSIVGARSQFIDTLVFLQGFGSQDREIDSLNDRKKNVNKSGREEWKKNTRVAHLHCSRFQRHGHIVSCCFFLIFPFQNSETFFFFFFFFNPTLPPCPFRMTLSSSPSPPRVLIHLGFLFC